MLLRANHVERFQSIVTIWRTPGIGRSGRKALDFETDLPVKMLRLRCHVTQLASTNNHAGRYYACL